MAFRKVAAALFLFTGVDLFLMALLPAVRLLVDPLLLLLIVFCSGARSPRLFWLIGLSLGLLKDLYSGSVFGAWACTFAAAGWAVGATRQMVSWEDPAVVGVWAAVLTLFAWLFFGFWLTLADPFVRWGNGRMSALPAAMAAQGLLTAWLYPRMRRLFSPQAKSYRW